MGKRRHGETPTPSWARRDTEIEVGNQKPDGVILDTVERMIYIIEGARYSDTEEAMETVEVTKIHKYRALREEHGTDTYRACETLCSIYVMYTA